jgi:hypothetical protein
LKPNTSATSTPGTLASKIWTDSSLENLLQANDSEFESFEKLLQSSSSIEAFLTEDEVKQWRIPVESLDIGDVVGRGAFGVRF